MEQSACVPADVSYFLCCTRKSKGSLHTWCPDTVPKYGTRWVLMWIHPFFKHTHARIRTRSQCPSTSSRTCTRAQKWTPGPCVYTVTSSVRVHSFVWVWNFRFQYVLSRKFWFTCGFSAYSKQSEVVILHNVIDETEDAIRCLECC